MATINQFDGPPKSRPHPSYYPVISNLSVGPQGLVTWTTDIASTSQVFYGKNVTLGLSTTTDPALVTSHSVQLQGLLSGTYYLKALSYFIDSLTTSDLYSFTSIILGLLVLEDGLSRMLLEDGVSKINLEV